MDPQQELHVYTEDGISTDFLSALHKDHLDRYQNGQRSKFPDYDRIAEEEAAWAAEYINGIRQPPPRPMFANHCGVVHAAAGDQLGIPEGAGRDVRQGQEEQQSQWPESLSQFRPDDSQTAEPQVAAPVKRELASTQEAAGSILAAMEAERRGEVIHIKESTQAVVAADPSVHVKGEPLSDEAIVIAMEKGNALHGSHIDTEDEEDPPAVSGSVEQPRDSTPVEVKREPVAARAFAAHYISLPGLAFSRMVWAPEQTVQCRWDTGVLEELESSVGERRYAFKQGIPSDLAIRDLISAYPHSRRRAIERIYGAADRALSEPPSKQQRVETVEID